MSELLLVQAWLEEMDVGTDPRCLTLELSEVILEVTEGLGFVFVRYRARGQIHTRAKSRVPECSDPRVFQLVYL